MEKTYRRKKLTVVGIFLLMMTLLLFSFYSLPAEAVGKTIVINPGHMAEKDPGTVNSSTGIREVDLNNALAIKTVATLRGAGYNAMLSHPVPGNPGLPSLLKTIPNYDYYSSTIVNAANSAGADLFLSLHHNSGGNASGYEFYWSSYHPSVDNDGIYQVPGLWPDGASADYDRTPSPIAVQSKELANSFNQNFKRLDYLPSRNKVVERDDRIIKLTSMPSVLIEAGFVSNNAESLKLADGNNQQKMADQITKTVNDFLGSASNPSSEPMTAGNLSAVNTGTKITATLTGVAAPNGVKTIEFPIWTDANGQDDIKWYEATRQSSGTYALTMDIKDHKNESGTYSVHAYGTDSSGKLYGLGTTTVTVGEQKIESMTASELTATSLGTNITAKIIGVTAPNGVKALQFPIWSENNGQDDLRWYGGTLQTDGSYSVSIDTREHKSDTGIYNVHCYGTDNSDKTYGLGTTTVAVTASKNETMTISEIKANALDTKITVKATGVTAPNGVENLQFPIWSENNGQDDLKWYAAQGQSDGSYTASIDIKDHNNETGVYNVHCYGTDNNGKIYGLGNTSTLVGDEKSEPMAVTEIVTDASENKITVKAVGIKGSNGIKMIQFPVWSDLNGQDDLRWYTGERQSDGSYTVNIDIKDHNNETGVYNIHCYGTDNGGKVTGLGTKTVTVGNIKTDSMTAIEVDAKIITGNKILASVSGVAAANGVKSIDFPVWSEVNGQDDMQWYKATLQSDNTYTVTVDVKDHKSDAGVYSIHCYGTDNNDKRYYLGKAELTLTVTPIMGSSTVNVQQLVNYYKSTGATYPQYYTNLGVDLETFAKLYSEEAKAEGVRAEVAFAQAMVETGNLAFGGDVKKEQFNFAGLGATGGIPGFNFAEKYGNNATGLQIGIRAQVQHLKCYASDKALNQENVDPRWGEWIRLKASTVEELAGTWAMDPKYASSLLRVMSNF